MKSKTPPWEDHMSRHFAVWFVTPVLIVGTVISSVLLLSAQAAIASTDSVTTCAGSGPGSLPVVVSAAASGDTIAFSVKCPTTKPIKLSSTIDINENLTIAGLGATETVVSGNKTVGVFEVASDATVTISGVTIEDGYADEGAGVTNNGILTIADSTLADNAAGVPGQADTGGGVLNQSGSLTIESSKLLGNTAGEGGGINSSATLTVENSTISGSDGSYIGGGILSYDGLSVSGSTISDNDSGEGGGGLFNFGGDAQIANTTFSGDNGTYGGGIQNGGTLGVAVSTFSGNTCGQGCGIYNQGGGLSITTSTFSDNGQGNSSAGTSDGGAIFMNYGSLTLSTSTLSGNSAPQGTESGGGALYVNDASATITASTLAGNSSDEGGAIYSGPGGGGPGGGSVSVAATIVAESAGGDCHGSITDDGYNLDDDGSCGFSATNHSQSDIPADLGPLQNNGGPTETQVPGLDSSVLSQIPPGTTANGLILCPGTDQRGVSRPSGVGCDIGSVEVPVDSIQVIDSPDLMSCTLKAPCSFTVTTVGNPIKLTEAGTLPSGLTFKRPETGVGTAVISGTPTKAATDQVTITATFGNASNKYEAVQTFTVDVSS
jgi:hypothetical protein